MRAFCGRRALFALLGLLAIPSPAVAQRDVPVVEGTGGGVEARLQRIERLLDSRGMLDLLDQVERLNHDLKRLRGEIELQAHSLDRLEERSRKWYDELHRRMEVVEGTAGREPPAAPPSTEAPPQTPPAEPAAPPVGEAPREPAPVARAEPTPPAPSEPRAAPTAPETGAAALDEGAAPSAGSPASDEDEAYRSAFNLLKSGEYEKAVAAFDGFLARFPGSNRADTAQYWMAEAHYVAHQYQPAIEAYQKLVKNYPESQKLTHAMLKIGYSYHELGQLAEAQTSLENLRLRYPGTTAAQLAEERLQRIRVEQH